MRRTRDISTVVNYPKDERDLKELQKRKARIMLEILREKYDDEILNEYINSMREKKEDYS